MNGIDVFPTKFFEFQLDKVDSLNILNEIKRKEKDIKLISSTRQFQSVNDYITDYHTPSNSGDVIIENLDKVFKPIEVYFNQYNADFRVIGYWTAVYIKNGFHTLHNHQEFILDKRNYSGIIYLSDIGGTTFYSTSPSSFQTIFYSKSSMGKVLIFPSSIPHDVEPTFDEKNKRYIISFNCEIRYKNE